MTLASAVSAAVSLVVAFSPQAIHTGTGFNVKSDAHATQLVTAAHVVDGASRVVVIFQDGTDFTATILARDRIRDAAVLSVDVGNRPTLALTTQPPTKNDAVTIVGFPGIHKFAVAGTDLRLIGDPAPVVVNGEVEATQQSGESLVFRADVGHGDSGAPIVDRTTNVVIGLTTGTYRAAGILLEYNGMDLGLSGAGLATVLHPALPAAGAQPPQYVVAVAPAAPASASSSIAAYVHSTIVQNFAEQSDFIAVDSPFAKDSSAVCRSANAHAVASVSGSSDGALVAAGLVVTDCIGNPFFSESQSLLADQPTAESERAQAGLLTIQLEADFNGWVDAQRGAWVSLLRYGFAIAPDDAHHYALIRLGADALNANHVYAVFGSGPGAVAGLRRGDEISSIGGIDAKGMSPADIRSALDRPSATLVVERGAKTLTITVRPRKFPELVRMLGYAQ